jgi:hypothetical protein
VVRHHLVQRIIRAYDERKSQVAEEQMSLLDMRVPGNEKANERGKDPVRLLEANAKE